MLNATLVSGFNRYMFPVFSRSAALVATLCLGAVTTSALAEAMRVNGEASRTTTTAAKSTLDQSFLGGFDAAAPTVSFFAVDPARIETARQGNVSSFRKATQIGITQLARDEAFDSGVVALSWQPAPIGGMVARFKVRSPGALATRIGLKTAGLPFGTELRFAGSAAPESVIHNASLREISTLLDDEKRYWTPMTDGDTQLLELHAPYANAASRMEAVVEVNAVSHIFASAQDSFKAATTLKGASGACNVDAICPTQTQGYVNAKNAVAHMVFQANCGNGGALSSCICTGTLLNDTVPGTQIPYFYSANHCMSTQGQANTLTTYWNYDNPVCRGADITRAQSNIVQGGATLLYNDNNSDVLLLRLNGTPPATAFFAGWDSAAIGGSVSTTIIHHPAGDPKKVTLGLTPASPFTTLTDMGGASYVTSTYTSGVTEGGSSGSGVFTTDTSGSYFLRGGLLGGPSSCATAGDPSNPSNRDYYSRFDLAYPTLKQWLAPEATTGPLNYSDMWWAGQSENGWGMSIQQHSPSNQQFNALYIYDNFGLPRWYVMPGGTWSNNFTTFSGALYQPTGSPLNTYDANALTVNPSPGTATLTFTSLNSATLQYTINGVSGTKSITRQSFTGGTAPFNVADLWWGGQSQNGWGINIAQQGGTLFAVWYTYGNNNLTSWYVVPGGTWSGNSYSGTMYSTTGSPWLGATYNPNALVVTTAGTITFNFSSANAAVMNYVFSSGPFVSLNQSKSIVRQSY